MRYLVTVESEPREFYVESELPELEVRATVEGAIEAYGLDGWADRYDPITREAWAQHPRRNAGILHDLPELDIEVDDPEHMTLYTIDVAPEPEAA